MAMVGGAGMGVVDGMHVGQSRGCMSGDVGALPECELKTPMTPDHTAVQARSYISM